MVTSGRSARREAGSGRRGRPRRSAPRRWRCGRHGPQHGSGKPVERGAHVDDQQEAGHRDAVVALSAPPRSGALSPSDTAGSSPRRQSQPDCRSRRRPAVAPRCERHQAAPMPPRAAQAWADFPPVRVGDVPSPNDAAKESNLPSGGLPRPAGFEDRPQGRQTSDGCWELLAGGTEKGTNGYSTARVTAAVRQATGSPPIPNAVLPVHQASSTVLCAAIDVNPELANHRPILRPRSASSHHDCAG